MSQWARNAPNPGVEGRRSACRVQPKRKRRGQPWGLVNALLALGCSVEYCTLCSVPSVNTTNSLLILPPPCCENGPSATSMSCAAKTCRFDANNKPRASGACHERQAEGRGKREREGGLPRAKRRAGDKKSLMGHRYCRQPRDSPSLADDIAMQQSGKLPVSGHPRQHANVPTWPVFALFALRNALTLSWQLVSGRQRCGGCLRRP